MVFLWGAIILGMIPFGFAGASDRDFPSSGSAPEPLYLRNGGRIFRVETAAFQAESTSRAARSAWASIEISRAIFSTTQLEDGPEFQFNTDPTPSEFEVLGSDPALVAGMIGVDVRRARSWQHVVSYTRTLTSRDARATMQTPADTLTVSLLLTDTDEPATVRLELNDTTVDLAPEIAMPDVEWGSDQGRRALREIAANVRDIATFANAAAGLSLVVAELDDRSRVFPWGKKGSGSCWSPCLKCVAELGKGFLAISAVVAACGSIPFSSGLSALGCVATVVGVPLQELSAMIACAGCDECLNPPNEGDKGGDGAPPGDCPQGSHPGPTSSCGGHAPCCCNDDGPGSCGVP